MLLLLFFFHLLLLGLVSATDRPIIGVVSQWYRPDYFPGLLEADNHTSYIAASYVKWLEAAGAQVVPVIISIDDNEDLTEYFQEVFAGVNGLLIPGGATSISHSGYADASNAFFQMAKEANLAGDFFPIWGTCLGFEMMVLMANEGKPYRAACNSLEQAVPLELEEGWEESRLLGSASNDVIDQLTSLPVTVNFHRWCLTKENFTRDEMGDFWNLLSVNSDLEGMEFISTLEAKDFPFYATQFHPEKNMFEWAPWHTSIPHSREATSVSLYMVEHFVEAARQSSHQFPSRAAEESHMIYNHRAYFSGQEATDSGFTQVYLF